MSFTPNPTNFKVNTKKCFSLLESAERRYLIYIVTIQILMGLLDLVSLGLIGVVGSLSISGVQSQAPNSQIQRVLDFLDLQDSDFQAQIVTLALVTAILLVTKTVLSLFLSRRVVFYLSLKGAKISAKLINQVAGLQLSDIRRFPEQELLFAITSGVNVVLIGVIAAICNLVSDLSLLILLTFVLFVIDPLIGVLSVILFGIAAFSLYLGTRKRALRYGQIISEMNIASNNAILNLFSLYRELTVRNRKIDYVSNISKHRLSLARAIAEVNFLPNLSKYLLEITLVLGGVIVVGVQLKVNDAVNAAGALAVFITAASRITPALLRVQQSATGIRNSLGMAEFTLHILAELKTLEQSKLAHQYPVEEKDLHRDVDSEISFRNVHFQYPGKSVNVFSNLNLTIDADEMVAIVGPSGAGKTTLVDLLLGVLEPTQGVIQIAGQKNITVIENEKFSIGYVPQQVTLIEGTLRENVTFGFSAEEFTDSEVWEVLEKSELREDLFSLEITLDTRLGSGGQSLSGGQIQRLGIARAILGNPRILVMDEATSALDSETESKINSAIGNMKGSTTLVIIAHRLSSVMNSDRILYIDHGKLIFSGSFDEVRSNVPNFDLQLKLMGL
jgi:ABC-type multidrug transport system fused ATPase/permease subunit